MTDREIIEKVVKRYEQSGYCFVWGGGFSPLDYVARVLVRYTRWIEKARAIQQVIGGGKEE